MLLISYLIERQKATRQLKKLRKRLLEAQSEEEATIIKAKMHVAEVDLNYTQYYPLYQRYISLYPQKDSNESEPRPPDEHNEDTTEKPPMWAEVEKRMADGTLNQLRNGSSATLVSQGKSRSLRVPLVQSKAGSAKAKLTSTSAKHPQGSIKSKTRSSRQLEQEISDNGKQKVPKKVPLASYEEDESDGGFFEE